MRKRDKMLKREPSNAFGSQNITEISEIESRISVMYLPGLVPLSSEFL